MTNKEKAYKSVEELKEFARGFISSNDRHKMMSMYYDIIIYIEELEIKLKGYTENDMGL
jgi:hypothetical protein